MQNKANLLDTQMNVSYCFNKEYENKSGLLTMEKQTQSKPISIQKIQQADRSKKLRKSC